MSAAPSTLHRINGFDASLAMIAAMLRVRGGRWVQGAPTHLAQELLAELGRRGFFIGVEDAGFRGPVSDPDEFRHHSSDSSTESNGGAK